MPLFIKTEKFTSETMQLLPSQREHYLNEHRSWVSSLNQSDKKVSSGYLVNEEKLPGGGGLMVIKAKSFAEAKSLIQQDPIIVAGLVNWNLQEWIPVVGMLLE
ncbi:YciI family protein [Prochlorococcus sp. MIT 1307]|uniref:YciI family protein n=1 Tax=Prochlorococcus sp. MIT 1307 TaxID=3096219 RepID=UPI002A749313|nr:YciI family protein [Prochlorococcus sp. MIT 1307]